MRNKKYTVKELPISERPYEKCEQYGAASLSDAELLAVIIRTGSKEAKSVDLAYEILNLAEVNNVIGNLNYLDINDLTSINGIGRVKAVQIMCICELSKRMIKSSAKQSLYLTTPSSIACYYMEDLRHMEQEVLVLLMLNTKNRLICDKIITRGTVNSSLISAREIFIEALRNKAVYIILVHNHPSGDPTPSREDVLVTRNIKDAGNLIGISLLDHIIIGDNTYVSLKEREIL